MKVGNLQKGRMLLNKIECCKKDINVIVEIKLDGVNELERVYLNSSSYLEEKIRIPSILQEEILNMILDGKNNELGLLQKEFDEL